MQPKRPVRRWLESEKGTVRCAEPNSDRMSCRIRIRGQVHMQYGTDPFLIQPSESAGAGLQIFFGAKADEHFDDCVSETYVKVPSYKLPLTNANRNWGPAHRRFN